MVTGAPRTRLMDQISILLRRRGASAVALSEGAGRDLASPCRGAALCHGDDYQKDRFPGVFAIAAPVSGDCRVRAFPSLTRNVAEAHRAATRPLTISIRLPPPVRYRRLGWHCPPSPRRTERPQFATDMPLDLYPNKSAVSVSLPSPSPTAHAAPAPSAHSNTAGLCRGLTVSARAAP